MKVQNALERYNNEYAGTFGDKPTEDQEFGFIDGYIAGWEEAKAGSMLELKKLKEFKEYTHARMTEMGVPHEVPGPHTDAGCRIGGRFDYVEVQLKELREELEYVLSDWNELVWAIGGPAHGVAIGRTKELMRKLAALEAANPQQEREGP